jgi:CheY-like chemotaxis protein
MRVTEIAVTVAVAIIFLRLHEKSVWSILSVLSDKQIKIVAVPAQGDSLYYPCRNKKHINQDVIREQQRFWKRILIVDDDNDITITFKTAIEDNNNTTLTKKIEVHTSNNPVIALSEFKPNFYDLLLADINMPHMNGFELCEKILAIDINVRICFMSSGEINRKALREIYPSLTVGCFMRKPMTMDYLIKRIMSELD